MCVRWITKATKNFCYVTRCPRQYSNPELREFVSSFTVTPTSSIVTLKWTHESLQEHIVLVLISFIPVDWLRYIEVKVLGGLCNLRSKATSKWVLHCMSWHFSCWQNSITCSRADTNVSETDLFSILLSQRTLYCTLRQLEYLALQNSFICPLQLSGVWIRTVRRPKEE
jgi:hypothetical protein